MQIDVTQFENEIVYNARPGPQTLKLIEVEEKLDDDYNTYLALKFVNQWEEYHIEKFDPVRHARRLYHIACAIGDECFTKHPDGTVSIDTDAMIGGYFRANLEHAEMENGDVTRSIYLRDIKASPRRKDTTGSRRFKKTRRKKDERKQTKDR